MTSWRNPGLSGRIPELDGIRGLAILLVLIWHYSIPLFQGLRSGSWPWCVESTATRLTWTGVDLFFVLSGFLIGGILFDAKASSNYFQTFYARRFYRILPLYFLWLAPFFAGSYFTHSWPDLFDHKLPLWPFPLFLQNFSVSRYHTWGSPWISTTWSLAVEEQFYLLLPLIVRMFSYRTLVRVGVAMVLLAPVARFAFWRSGNQFFGPYVMLPCRMDDLGFGFLIALAVRNERAWAWVVSHRRHIGAAMIALALGTPLLVKAQPSIEAAFASGVLIGALTGIGGFYALLLLLVLASLGKPATAFFRSRPMRALGTWAYAIYLFHVGVLYLTQQGVFLTGHRGYWTSAAVTLLAVPVVLALAAASWRMLEHPLVRHAHKTFRYELKPISNALLG